MLYCRLPTEAEWRAMKVKYKARKLHEAYVLHFLEAYSRGPYG